jgi:hypothetical protein
METRDSKGEAAKEVSTLQFPVSHALGEGRSTSKYILLAGAAMAVVVAIVIIATRPRPRGPEVTVALTPEQQAYLPYIGVGDARMSAAENFLGQTVIYMDAEVTNRGDRNVKQVDIQMEFTDVLGQVILRDRAQVLPPNTPPLKPGETRAFQLFFDRMPAEWNQAPPRISIRSVQF